ncbi:MAG TPA: amino acid permease, partial [bacterium]|nr:amino acid permease [bacterium]
AVHHTVVIPISGIQHAVVRALQYAKSMGGDDIRAVYVNLNPDVTQKLQDRWAEWGLGIPLVILESPYRSVMEPLMRYIDSVSEEKDTDFITVLLPEFVTAKWWQAFLHNQTATMIRAFLGGRKNVVVTSMRYHLEE